jgi:hypothetical protein
MNNKDFFKQTKIKGNFNIIVNRKIIILSRFNRKILFSANNRLKRIC